MVISLLHTDLMVKYVGKGSSWVGLHVIQGGFGVELAKDGKDSADVHSLFVLKPHY
jgi:hypothetical protein